MMRLEDHKNMRPFSTPDGYFEELNRNIIEATSKAPSAPVAKKSIALGRWAKALSYAAMLAIVALVANKVIFDKVDKSTDMAVMSEETALDNEFYDSLLENYPIDNYTFYCCLTEYE